MNKNQYKRWDKNIAHQYSLVNRTAVFFVVVA